MYDIVFTEKFHELKLKTLPTTKKKSFYWQFINILEKVSCIETYPRTVGTFSTNATLTKVIFSLVSSVLFIKVLKVYVAGKCCHTKALFCHGIIPSKVQTWVEY